MKYIARKAAGLPADDLELERIVGSSQYIIMRRVVGSIVSSIVINRNGLLWCGICGRGTFTRRGLYLHLTRVHRDDILDLIEQKYSEIKAFYDKLYNTRE